MIQELAEIIYTQDSVLRASEYLRTRKVDPSKLRFPVALTDRDTTVFQPFCRRYPPNIFTDSIYFPITDICDPNQLIGFDVRYVGADETRLRYHKFKDDPNTFLLYYSQTLDKINPRKPVIITEGFIDAETIRDLGFDVLSPLTAMHNFKFLCFLKAISNNIWFAYDNDAGGKQALASIIKESSIDSEFRKCFKFLNFMGKDLNAAVRDYGRDYLFSILKAQIC